MFLLHPSLLQHQLFLLSTDGGTWESFNKIGSWPRKQRVLIYGPNQVPVFRPNILAILVLLLQNPLLIVQVLTHLPYSIAIVVSAHTQGVAAAVISFAVCFRHHSSGVLGSSHGPCCTYALLDTMVSLHHHHRQISTNVMILTGRYNVHH